MIRGRFRGIGYTAIRFVLPFTCEGTPYPNGGYLVLWHDGEMIQAERIPGQRRAADTYLPPTRQAYTVHAFQQEFGGTNREAA